MPSGNKNHKSSKPHKGKMKTGKEDKPGVAFSTKGIDKKKAETTAVGSRQLEEVVWEACGDERINLPPVNGHTGVFAYHMDDCLCNMGGWPCYRDGSLWSCCGSTNLHSYCEKAPVKKIKPKKNRGVKNIVESSSDSSDGEHGESGATKQNKESESGEFRETKEIKEYESEKNKAKEEKASGTKGLKKSGPSESEIKESKESKTSGSEQKETKEKVKKTKAKQRQSHPTRINILWEGATKVSNLPPIRGHTGVFALHMDDCLCGMAGWPCYRDGYIWSCCGSTDENSHCSSSGKK